MRIRPSVSKRSWLHRLFFLRGLIAHLRMASFWRENGKILARFYRRSEGKSWASMQERSRFLQDFTCSPNTILRNPCRENRNRGKGFGKVLRLCLIRAGETNRAFLRESLPGAVGSTRCACGIGAGALAAHGPPCLCVPSLSACYTRAIYENENPIQKEEVKQWQPSRSLRHSSQLKRAAS